MSTKERDLILGYIEWVRKNHGVVLSRDKTFYGFVGFYPPSTTKGLPSPEELVDVYLKEVLL